MRLHKIAPHRVTAVIDHEFIIFLFADTEKEMLNGLWQRTLSDYHTNNVFDITMVITQPEPWSINAIPIMLL